MEVLSVEQEYRDEVEDNHTYFVKENAVLEHNYDPKGFIDIEELRLPVKPVNSNPIAKYNNIDEFLLSELNSIGKNTKEDKNQMLLNIDFIISIYYTKYNFFYVCCVSGP
ncbi:MAG: hypothetical protein H7A25_22780 [Leptospiraceae bacterium]|nr:hypothetical protein [Leptospiraceae bacterium]MCP5502742.1 hypothetical protein [Leptospiraceae bacterium]